MKPVRTIYTEARDATFEELYKIAVADRDVVVISADMGARKFKEFKRDIPDQFYNVGVSEQNAISVAGGLAVEGKIPFVYGIGNFVTLRCYEQLKVDVACMNLPVTVIGMGAGYVYSIDGPTHHITQDIAVMRCLPGMTIWSPSDYTMAGGIIPLAYRTPGPKYIRLDKGPFTPMYEPDSAEFTQGCGIVRNGTDLTIVATGVMTTQALQVADDLEASGISARVVDVYRLKPVDAPRLASLLDGTARIVTLEEHSIVGGLGSIILETLSDHGIRVPVLRLALPDQYRFEVGSRDYLRRLDGLDRHGVTRKIMDWAKNPTSTAAEKSMGDGLRVRMSR
ncbi:MAG: 1-deoxy-D-xylulose-5-phosphate synthase [Euryarchaeota archaeon]|nr:1-deoxy-D-xylulose-5-phosphate synthase [Euryarchaeota archaeon]